MAASVLEGSRVRFVAIDRIRPNPIQPRQVFEPTALRELAESIRQHGVLQPLAVRRTPAGLELVAGERRLRASRLAGLQLVPCIIVNVDAEQSGLLALVENLQRQDLDYIEEAEGLASLMRLYGFSQEQAAVKVGKSQSAVANKLRLLKHPPQVLDALRQHGLSERHARALLRVPVQQRMEVIEAIVQGGFTVARTESYIDRLLTAPVVRQEMNIKLRNLRLFLNGLDRELERGRAAGLECRYDRQEQDGETVVTIRVKAAAAQPQ